MNKLELIKKICISSPHLYEKVVERIVNVIFEEIIGTLERGGKVNLYGFGRFSIGLREGKVVQNPKIGRVELDQEKLVITFLAGKILRDSLNSAFDKRDVDNTENFIRHKNLSGR